MSREKENQEDVLAGQIPEFKEETVVDNTPEAAPEKGLVGSKLGYKQKEIDRRKDDKDLVERKHLTRVGEKIGQNAEIRDGWIDVDRALLGERNRYYPEDWVFRIKPASVEVVRNWSTVDEENPNSVDEVFNEILKYSLLIKTSRGILSYTQLNNWDRFFFVLLVREYTFIKGENKVEFTKDCPSCGAEVNFELTSQALMYDLPDESVIRHYDCESQTWNVDPSEFDVETDEELITLYLPTIEKDIAIKAWIISKLREDENSKLDSAFIKFLPWMCQKFSKDEKTAQKQIRQAYLKFKSYDADEFSFINDIINNIIVTPEKKLKSVCPDCGEEVFSTITFPNGLGSLFNVVHKSKKFGNK